MQSHGDDFMDREGRECAFLRKNRVRCKSVWWLQTGGGQVGVRLVTGIAARRTETWVREHEEVERGQTTRHYLAVTSRQLVSNPPPHPVLIRAKQEKQTRDRSRSSAMRSRRTEHQEAGSPVASDDAEGRIANFEF